MFDYLIVGAGFAASVLAERLHYPPSGRTAPRRGEDGEPRVLAITGASGGAGARLRPRLRGTRYSPSPAHARGD